MNDGGQGEVAGKIIAETPAETPPAPAEPGPADCLGIPCQSEAALKAFASIDFFEELEHVLRRRPGSSTIWAGCLARSCTAPIT